MGVCKRMTVRIDRLMFADLHINIYVVIRRSAYFGLIFALICVNVCLRRCRRLRANELCRLVLVFSFSFFSVVPFTETINKNTVCDFGWSPSQVKRCRCGGIRFVLFPNLANMTWQYLYLILSFQFLNVYFVHHSNVGFFLVWATV